MLNYDSNPEAFTEIFNSIRFEMGAILDADSEFFAAYIAAMQFTEITPDSNTDDQDFTSETDLDEILSGDSQAAMAADCINFLRLAMHPIAAYCIETESDLGPSLLEDLGHDFWLTRNGHGAGFSDGGWNPTGHGAGEYGDALTEIAEELGKVDVYEGDDGRAYTF